VVIGIETDRGPWVQALLAAGYRVYAINPRQAARYRERYSTSGAKSDQGDAHVLAELVGLDRMRTARSPATASWPRPSRSLPAPTRR
jgi:transposase